MDAHMPVTHEEGDRYPLGPPNNCPGGGMVDAVDSKSTIERCEGSNPSWGTNQRSDWINLVASTELLKNLIDNEKLSRSYTRM